jgi:hypothetical protein
MCNVVEFQSKGQRVYAEGGMMDKQYIEECKGFKWLQEYFRDNIKDLMPATILDDVTGCVSILFHCPKTLEKLVGWHELVVSIEKEDKGISIPANALITKEKGVWYLPRLDTLIELMGIKRFNQVVHKLCYEVEDFDKLTVDDLTLACLRALKAIKEGK